MESVQKLIRTKPSAAAAPQTPELSLGNFHLETQSWGWGQTVRSCRDVGRESMLSDGFHVLSSGLCTSGGQEAPRMSNWPLSGTVVSRSGEFNRIWLRGDPSMPRSLPVPCFPQYDCRQDTYLLDAM